MTARYPPPTASKRTREFKGRVAPNGACQQGLRRSEAARLPMVDAPVGNRSQPHQSKCFAGGQGDRRIPTAEGQAIRTEIECRIPTRFREIETDKGRARGDELLGRPHRIDGRQPHGIDRRQQWTSRRPERSSRRD